jgi:hypothetical protein
VGNSDRRFDRYSMVVHMSEFIWCHGPECHTNKTQDRVRGTKGNKVLRTRKIKQRTENSWYSPDSIYNYFCSERCIRDFWNTHAQRVIALAPRTEALETPIDDPTKVKHTGNYTYPDGTQHTWTTTEIKERVDTITE